MYPKPIFWTVDLYTILLTVGILAAMVMVRFLSDKRGLKGELQNFVLINTVVTVIGGYGLAVVTQAFYNMEKNGGKFVLNNSTGSTFYGGLVGGIALFLIGYFVVGKFLFKTGYNVKHFRTVSDIAACAIAVGHGFGRLGCLMAGCCYGAKTDAWYGIYMQHLGHKVVPVQLYEALFLFALCAVMTFLVIKKIRFQMPIYLLSYGVWRFLIEYVRDDYRGSIFGLSWLSPSQVISIGLFLAGIILFVCEICADRKHAKLTPVLAAEETAPMPADITEAVTDEVTEAVTEEVGENMPEERESNDQEA